MDGVCDNEEVGIGCAKLFEQCKVVEERIDSRGKASV